MKKILIKINDFFTFKMKLLFFLILQSILAITWIIFQPDKYLVINYFEEFYLEGIFHAAYFDFSTNYNKWIFFLLFNAVVLLILSFIPFSIFFCIYYFYYLILLIYLLLCYLSPAIWIFICNDLFVIYQVVPPEMLPEIYEHVKNELLLHELKPEAICPYSEIAQVINLNQPYPAIYADVQRLMTNYIVAQVALEQNFWLQHSWSVLIYNIVSHPLTFYTCSFIGVPIILLYWYPILHLTTMEVNPVEIIHVDFDEVNDIPDVAAAGNEFATAYNTDILSPLQFFRLENAVFFFLWKQFVYAWFQSILHYDILPFFVDTTHFEGQKYTAFTPYEKLSEYSNSDIYKHSFVLSKLNKLSSFLIFVHSVVYFNVFMFGLMLVAVALNFTAIYFLKKFIMVALKNIKP